MKRLVLPVLFAFALLAPAADVSAARIGLKEVVRALETPFKAGSSNAVKDVQADFFQKSRIEALDRVQRGRGQVSFRFLPGNANRAPVAMFKWEYEVPTRQEIVSDGKTMWVYLPDNRQVIESEIGDVARADAASPITFLSGLGNLSRDFRIGWGHPDMDEKGNYILELHPKRSSPLIRELVLIVDRDAAESLAAGRNEIFFPILASTVLDHSGNRTTIEFNNIRVNRGLGALDFRFIQPPGVEVVRPSGSDMGF